MVKNWNSVTDLTQLTQVSWLRVPALDVTYLTRCTLKWAVSSSRWPILSLGSFIQCQILLIFWHDQDGVACLIYDNSTRVSSGLTATTVQCLAVINLAERKNKRYESMPSVSRPITSLRSHPQGLQQMYRVTLVVSDLGWVDWDLGCSTLLLGQ